MGIQGVMGGGKIGKIVNKNTLLPCLQNALFLLCVQQICIINLMPIKQSLVDILYFTGRIGSREKGGKG